MTMMMMRRQRLLMQHRKLHLRQRREIHNNMRESVGKEWKERPMRLQNVQFLCKNRISALNSLSVSSALFSFFAYMWFLFCAAFFVERWKCDHLHAFNQSQRCRIKWIYLISRKNQAFDGVNLPLLSLFNWSEQENRPLNFFFFIFATFKQEISIETTGLKESGRFFREAVEPVFVSAHRKYIFRPLFNVIKQSWLGVLETWKWINVKL